MQMPGSRYGGNHGFAAFSDNSLPFACKSKTFPRSR
jgi:hypothetical protein